jgi:hypothetical protein
MPDAPRRSKRTSQTRTRIIAQNGKGETVAKGRGSFLLRAVSCCVWSRETHLGQGLRQRITSSARGLWQDVWKPSVDHGRDDCEMGEEWVLSVQIDAFRKG